MTTMRLLAQIALLSVLGGQGCGGGSSGGNSGGAAVDSGLVISGQPQDTSVVAGQPATFTVSATGKNTLTYQWSRDGQIIAGANASSYTISNTAPADEGSSFTVQINDGNSTSSAASMPAILHVGAAPSGGISLFAGGLGGPGYTDGVGSAARFNGATAVAVDSSGNVFIADSKNHVIRKVSPSGVVSTFAGSPGQAGYIDAATSAARFSRPTGVALDASGNLYVSDSLNYVIRKITPTGVVTTLAGRSGVAGSDDGAGAAATFGNYLGTLATDAAGNVYVTQYSTLRKVSPSGVVSTLAGAYYYAGTIDGLGSAARFGGTLASIAVDSEGVVYVLDANNYTIRRVTPTGGVSTFVGSPGQYGTTDGTGAAAQITGAGGIGFDAAGDLILIDGSSIRKIDTQGVVKTIAHAQNSKSVDEITAVAVEKTGGIVLMTQYGTMMWRVALDGTSNLIAGSVSQNGLVDGRGSGARFTGPGALAVDGAGNTYVADTGKSTIRKISPSGVVTTFAGGTRGTADGAGAAAAFEFITAMTIDSQGNLFVADTWNGWNAIRKVTPAGVVTTIANLLGLDSINSVAVDSSGNILACGFALGVRSITPSGAISVISPAGCTSLVVDPTGTIYLFTGSDLIKLNADGTPTRVAGGASESGFQDGTGEVARFSSPYDRYSVGDPTYGAYQMTTDALGNIYLADSGNAAIRKITPTGMVTTVVGVGNKAQVILGSPGGLNHPGGLAIAKSTSGLTLVISDAAENALLLAVVQ